MHLALCDFSFNSQIPVVLTPTRLFADVLSAQFVDEQLKGGRASWERPLITTVYAWMAKLWQEKRYAGADLPTLLSPAQERALWQQILEREHPDLFDFASAARLASEASRALAEWRIPLDDEVWDEKTDAAHFRELYLSFRRECRERGCIGRSGLWRLLPLLLDDSERLALVGFDVLSPALRSLPANVYSLAEPTSRKKKVPAFKQESLASELEYCARWARRIVEDNASQSVGILIPNLPQCRNDAVRIFEDVFYPSSNRSAGSAFHIHASKSLLDDPVVAAADLILELAGSDLLAGDASAILRSPYITGSAAERSPRALADLQLRQRRDLRVTFKQMESRTINCLILQKVWADVRQVLRSQPRVASLAEWSEWISRLLSATGWPGDADRKPAESDGVESWKDALTQLSALTYVLPPVPFDIARRELRRMLASLSAPCLGNIYSPVQIVDAAAAAGTQFDAAALCGFSENAWPPPEKVQPFIPFRLQRQAGIPGTAPISVAVRRLQQTAMLFSAAKDQILTFTESLAPPARVFVQVKSIGGKMWEGQLPSESFEAAELEMLEDETAPPLAAGGEPLGGVSIIKAQSHCPFQAFARYRLLADEPENSCFGLDARERGGFLHKALEHVWLALETSDRLRDLAENDLRGLISEAVVNAVREDGRSPFHELVSDTERIRLNDVIFDWLQFEKRRKIPFRVEHIEAKQTLELAGLPLNLRVDRVDRLPDGSVLLLDYKSGLLNAKDLGSNRPREPQLLVYASAVAEEIDGVYIAQVRAREIKAQGMSAREHFPESRKSKDAPSWQGERVSAREKLESIAREFVAGYAAVDPQKEACTYCGLNLLCRVADAGATSADEDGNE